MQGAAHHRRRTQCWCVLIEVYRCPSDEQLRFPGSSVAQPSVAVMPDMTLSCWIRSATTGILFSINISSTKTITDLKDVIKNENAVSLRDIGASARSLQAPQLRAQTLQRESQQNHPLGANKTAGDGGL